MRLHVPAKRTMRLRAVFDDPQMMFLSNSKNVFHQGGLPVNMDRNHCFCFCRYGLLNFPRIDGEVLIFDIDEDRLCSGQDNSRYRRHRRVRNSYHFIPRTDAARGQCEMQGFRTTSDANGAGDTGKRRKFLLKSAYFISENIISPIKHSGNG
jgi:hypothetical protein